MYRNYIDMYFFLFFVQRTCVYFFVPNKNRKTNLYSTFHRNGITKNVLTVNVNDYVNVVNVIVIVIVNDYANQPVTISESI